MLTSMTGCNESLSSSLNNNKNNYSDSYMKHLDMGVSSFGSTLDPVVSTDGWNLMRYGVGECLVHYDDNMNWESWLAKSWTLDDDQLTWTFQIEDNIKFSNGNPLTATAVKASIERVFEKCGKNNKENTTGNIAENYFSYNKITADDENNTLKIVTKEKTPTLPGILGYPLFAIVDVSTENNRDFKKDGPICTGPYAIVSNNDKTVEMKANESYRKGTVPFETVSVHVIADDSTRAMALQTNEIQLAVNVSYTDLDEFKNNDNYIVDSIASARTCLEFLNQHEGEPLENDSLRKAVLMATDQETLCNITVGGLYTAGTAPLPSSLDYGFSELKDKYAYNLDNAKKLLDDSGITDNDGDGYRELNGENISLDMVYYESRSINIFCEAIASTLNSIGIKVNAVNTDYDTMLNRAQTYDYDFCVWNVLTLNCGDPTDYMKYWYTDSSTNYSGYSNKEYDSLFDELSIEFDTKKRRELIIKMQQILMNDAALLVDGYYNSNIIGNSKLNGIKMYIADYYWLTDLVCPSSIQKEE